MQSLRTLFLLGGAVAVVTTSAAQEQMESLKSIARRSGGAVVSQIAYESPRMSLSELAQMAELIVRGRLMSMTTRLSDDETTVFRDFAVTPIAIIKEPQDFLRVKTPGPMQTLTLRQLGGRLTVDGLKLSTITNFEDRETPMEAGQEYVLFLAKAGPSRSTTMSTGTNVYQLSAAHWGAYPIRHGKIGNFTKWLAQKTDRSTDDPEAFAALIRDLAKPINR